MTSVPPAQPPAAPESDVSEFRAALEAACLEGLHLTTWGPRYSPKDGADAVERIVAERLRVVEGERRRWQDKAQEAGEAYANANSRHHEELDRANRLEGLADRLAERAVELEDEARTAIARAESAEAAHDAEKAAHERLRAGAEALADEWEADRGRTWIASLADDLRSLLGGGGAR